MLLCVGPVERSRTATMVLIWNCLSVVHKGRTDPVCLRASANGKRRFKCKSARVSAFDVTFILAWEVFCRRCCAHWTIYRLAIFIFVVMPSNQCIKCSNRNRICKRCQLLIIVSMSINIETKSMGVAGTITNQKRKKCPMPDASTTHIVRWNILMIIPLFWPIKYSTLRWQI